MGISHQVAALRLPRDSRRSLCLNKPGTSTELVDSFLTSILGIVMYLEQIPAKYPCSLRLLLSVR